MLSGLFDIYNDIEYQLYIETINRDIPDVMITIQANMTKSEYKINNII